MANDTPYSFADEDVVEFISDKLGVESWAEGKTLTVMLSDESGERRFAKLRLVRVADRPSAADMRGAPE
jgi:hypothetical protein